VITSFLRRRIWYPQSQEKYTSKEKNNDDIIHETRARKNQTTKKKTKQKFDAQQFSSSIFFFLLARTKNFDSQFFFSHFLFAKPIQKRRSPEKRFCEQKKRIQRSEKLRNLSF